MSTTTIVLKTENREPQQKVTTLDYYWYANEKLDRTSTHRSAFFDLPQRLWNPYAYSLPLTLFTLPSLLIRIVREKTCAKTMQTIKHSKSVSL